ncbi:ATP-dependent Lon protease pim1 [Entophlyctis luteolus]|nr:ATP-dependent Lon protease pim1 [Entophlyctis luteolus]
MIGRPKDADPVAPASHAEPAPDKTPDCSTTATVALGATADADADAAVAVVASANAVSATVPPSVPVLRYIMSPHLNSVFEYSPRRPYRHTAKNAAQVENGGDSATPANPLVVTVDRVVHLVRALIQSRRLHFRLSGNLARVLYRASLHSTGCALSASANCPFDQNKPSTSTQDTTKDTATNSDTAPPSVTAAQNPGDVDAPLSKSVSCFTCTCGHVSTQSPGPKVTFYGLDSKPTFDLEREVVVFFPEFLYMEQPKKPLNPSKSIQTDTAAASKEEKDTKVAASKTSTSSTTTTTAPASTSVVKKPRTKAEKAEAFLVKIKNKSVPDIVEDMIHENIESLKGNDTSDSNSANKLLTYLTNLPWGFTSPETTSIRKVKQHLASNHYGLEAAKSLILQFLATNKLSKRQSGRVLCLIGSPGVGKTSLAESIAHSLNRKFARIPLPSVSNGPDLVGHTRTWRGAEPGAIVKALMRAQTANPVILLDEIDKLATGTSNGDVNGTLLSILDPEQNHEFFDFYVGVHIDLSQVMFICTANSVTKIDATLLDRMEVLELEDYTTEQKVDIGLKYLWPKELEKLGIISAEEISAHLPFCNQPKVSMSRDVMVSIVNLYCTDGGVRDLKRAVEKIGRNLAYEIVVEQDIRRDGKVPDGDEGLDGTAENETADGTLYFTISEHDLIKYLGPSLDVCTVCRSENSNYAAPVCRHEMCLTCWKKTLVLAHETGPCPFCRKTVKLLDLRKKN